jgi:carotenoid cleavage dioxygenase
MFAAQKKTNPGVNMSTPMPDNPFLQGFFEPLQMECDAPDLIIEGEIPKDLNGSFYRNGPNPRYTPPGTTPPFCR